jgi:hypothetical protein
MELFIDTFFENATALRWEQSAADIVDLDLIADHARMSPNRQMTWWNFKIHTSPAARGGQLRLRFRPVTSCWNGTPAPALRRDPLTSVVSAEGRAWRVLPVCPSTEAGFVKELCVPIEGSCMHVAHLVPYNDSDLQATLAQLQGGPEVRIYQLGATVEGRPLEMVEIGAPEAPGRVLFRGRAHPWETGGSWLLEGLMRFLVSPAAADLRRRLCVCIMPMANKDGVARGLSRFTVTGMDLNRGWFANQPHDPVLCPENACLDAWLAQQQRLGRLPRLAICLHNDDGGNLHFSHPGREGEGHARRMDLFEGLLRDLTWFREGRAAAGFVNSGTFGEGLCEQYGIDALIYELRACWAAGLNRTPMPDDWLGLGRDLAFVLDRFFATVDHGK